MILSLYLHNSEQFIYNVFKSNILYFYHECQNKTIFCSVKALCSSQQFFNHVGTEVHKVECSKTNFKQQYVLNFQALTPVMKTCPCNLQRFFSAVKI